MSALFLLGYILGAISLWVWLRIPRLQDVDREFGAMRSPQWARVRREHLTRHPLCAVCGEKKGLEVHHVRPFHLFPALELDPGNLITLCDDHHLFFGHLGSFRSYNETVGTDAEYWITKLAKRP